MSVIRFILTAAFMLVGLFVCCVGVYGVFKLKYAANRMHAAALNDTLGVSFCLIGLAISAPDFFTALKFCWWSCFCGWPPRWRAICSAALRWRRTRTADSI